MRLLFLLACVGGEIGPQEPVSVRTWTTDVNASGGTLIVQTTHEPDLTVSVPVPEVDGLTFTDAGVTTERLGERTVLTQRYKFAGKKGFYEVPALAVSTGDPEVGASTLPMWIDLGKPAPKLEELEDIDEPDEVWEIPWGPIGAALGSIGLVMGGLLYAFAGVLMKPPRKIIRVLPPDVRCLTAWEAIQADATLTNEERAKELSRIFREYTEEVLGFPAASWTTTEILARLEGMEHLPKGNVPRAKNLLRATDLVKYADVSPQGDFFELRDADLRAFVGSTRPTNWVYEQEVEGNDGLHPTMKIAVSVVLFISIIAFIPGVVACFGAVQVYTNLGAP